MHGFHTSEYHEIRNLCITEWCSALPPPLQAGTFSRGVVTMRCDISTVSSAHISLLVSGSAQTCFDDQVVLVLRPELFYVKCVEVLRLRLYVPELDSD